MPATEALTAARKLRELIESEAELVEQKSTMTPKVVDALVDRVRIGGTLHLATDIEHYATAMIATCDAEPRLDGGVVDRPTSRPTTRFEQRGIDEGRAPIDMLYTRVP